MKVNYITPYTTVLEQKRKYTGFKAMKPSMFKGTDYACVRKFKAPVEKFNSPADLQCWALNCIKELLGREFTGRRETTEIQRRAMVAEWSSYLLNGNNIVPPALSLIILSAILKELKPNNDNVPPVLNKYAFEGALSDLNSILVNDKDRQFDFNKIYRQNMDRIDALDDALIKNSSGWLVIPSEGKDKNNFDENVNRLKRFSALSWCTKSFNAEYYLSKGDFHIYFENGKPKIALRFDNDILVEIQNEQNNNHISLKFFDILKKYIENNSFNLSGILEKCIQDSESKKAVIADIWKNVDDRLSNAPRIYKLMDYLGYKPVMQEDGLLSIGSYSPPDLGNNITMEDIGIDENRLFESIAEIRGDAVFAGTEVTNLHKVKRIGGNSDFEDSLVMSLGELEQIDGYANFANSLVNSAPKLKRINKWADFDGAVFENLPSLEYIGGNAYFNNSRIKKLDKLKYVGQFADFSNTEIQSLPSIKYIGNGYNCSNSNLRLKDFANIKEGSYI